MSYQVNAASSAPMDDSAAQQAYSTTPRHVQSQNFSPYPQDPSASTPNGPYPHNHHLDPSLQALDAGHSFHSDPFGPSLDDPQSHGQQLQLGIPPARYPTTYPLGLGPQTPHQHAHAHAHPSPGPPSGQFGILTPHNQLQKAGHGQNEEHGYAQTSALGRIQAEHGLLQTPPGSGAGKKEGGHFQGMKTILDPPDLAEWRQRLFDVEGMIALTEEQFQTYFPHVDNVYSHRSTQRYKRKPFVSHYWDCRLKGRPPGTPKSDDPNKKKRKRQARERDLCDVKIKITEYFPGARTVMGELGEEPNDGNAGNGGNAGNEEIVFVDGQGFTTTGALRFVGGGGQVPGTNGEKYYTVSRVNGSNGNGKGDGVPGPHKHDLEESDRVKKNSILRGLAKEEMERKKVQKTYSKKATGAALQCVKRHSKDHELKLYGSCFCPFVQRVWIALELKALPYQYVETDPYKKPAALVALNPLGLVPVLSHQLAPNTQPFSCHESTVLMEYFNDAFPESASLLPDSAQGRAHARLWADHVNKQILPAFYGTLQAQDAQGQANRASELRQAIDTLVKAADPEGPFFAGRAIGWVDVMLAPWLLRFSRVLGPYRGWPEPSRGSRWASWVEAVEADEAVRATTSDHGLYLDSYERYAENRPNTSQVADAINAGRALP